MTVKAFSAGMCLPNLPWRDFVGATSGTPDTAAQVAMTPIAATTLAKTGNLATFTSTTPHRFHDGQRIQITGADMDAYNGVFTITVLSATEFTYRMASEPADDADTTSVAASYTPEAQRMFIVADATNPAAITFGPNPAADFESIAAGKMNVVPIESPHGAKFGVSDWYVKSSAASQGYKVLFV